MRASPVQRVAMLLLYALLDGSDDGVTRARSAARAYRSWSSIISVVGCAPPNTRRAVRLEGVPPRARGFQDSR